MEEWKKIKKVPGDVIYLSIVDSLNFYRNCLCACLCLSLLLVLPQAAPCKDCFLRQRDRTLAFCCSRSILCPRVSLVACTFALQQLPSTSPVVSRHHSPFSSKNPIPTPCWFTLWSQRGDPWLWITLWAQSQGFPQFWITLWAQNWGPHLWIVLQAQRVRVITLLGSHCEPKKEWSLSLLVHNVSQAKTGQPRT